MVNATLQKDAHIEVFKLHFPLRLDGYFIPQHYYIDKRINKETHHNLMIYSGEILNDLAAIAP